MNLTYTILNLSSLASGIISVKILIVLGFLRPKFLTRVSLQFQLGIALLDITRHLQLHSIYTPENNALCTFIAFYGYFSDHLYIFLNVAIALNLQLLLVNKIKPIFFLKWVYWIAAFVISFTIDLVPLSLNYLGRNFEGRCLLKSNVPNRRILKVFLVHLVIWPGAIYCLCISVLVIYRFYYKNIQKEKETVYSQSEVRNLSWTIALYPLTCFLSEISYLSYNSVLDIFKYSSNVLLVLSISGLCSTGLLNLLCLLLDHQVWTELKSFTKRNSTKLHEFELNNKLDPTEEGIINIQSESNIINASNQSNLRYEQREQLIRFL